MKLPNDEVIVVDIAGNKARLFVTDDRRVGDLKLLGFEQQGDQFVRLVTDDDDRRRLIHTLIKMDVVFSAGPGWSPSELLEHYVRQGEKFDAYRVISWSGQDSYSIQSH